MTSKQKLFALLETVKRMVSFESKLSHLTEHGCTRYERRGVLTGLIFEGKKYRLSRLGLIPQSGLEQRISDRGISRA